MARSVILKNGEQVKVNDHVYASPSWSIRDGTPYSIGRIMEFLPPADVPRSSTSLTHNPSSSSSDTSNKPEYLYTRVRLAWYYRPGDVSDRSVSDSRLLLAAIFSEICDINQIRGRCHVVHRDKITDLSGWKKRPDRFYFKSLFDPYVKREFEIIASGDVRNLPDHIRDTLISRYEYVVAEKEVIPDLTDSIRLCKTCQDWCPTPESVQCDRCKSYFHMSCVNPPLAAKPSRGYGWTCAPCAKEHDEAVDSNKNPNESSNRTSTPNNAQPSKPSMKSNAPPARGRGRPRKDKGQAEREENFPVKHFRMWPFRYFGQYTVAEDTLDPEDLIFPRTSTRHGPKYQANVPAAPELDINPSEPDERGGDNTIEVLGIINTLTESEIEEVEARKQELAGDSKNLNSVDWLTEVIRRLSDAALLAKPWSSVNMKSPMRTDKWKKFDTPYTDKEWTRDEVAAFEDAIALHGAELRAVKEEVSTRSMPEVVRFYGLWKNSKLQEENQERRRSGSPVKDPPGTYPTDNPKFVQHVGLSDRESSVITSPSKPPTCAACRAKESTQWWKAPKGLSTNVMCDNCGQNWRKYADLVVRPARDESVTGKRGDREKSGTAASAGDKREGTPLTAPVAKKARAKSRSASVEWTTLREFRNLKEMYSIDSPSPPPPPQIECMVCTRSGMMGQVLECSKCKFRVHAGTGGVDLAPTNRKEFEMWMCDLCRNEEAQEASLNTDCLLCPRTQPGKRSTPFHPPANNYLRACKPTEGQGWAHILCAVYTPEITFSEAPKLKLIEGISTIPKSRWTSTCKICEIAQGSTVRCSDCSMDFHVSCAWKAGYKFGFEIQHVKGSKRESTIMVTFKNETGCMIPVIQCKEHDAHKYELHNVCERDGSETALQVYCQAYKQALAGQSHALLRKARRLDQILNIKSEPVPPPAPVAPSTAEPQCHRCSTTISPAFHRVTVPSSPGTRTDSWLCHKCHFSSTQSNGVAESPKMVGINEP